MAEIYDWALEEAATISYGPYQTKVLPGMTIRQWMNSTVPKFAHGYLFPSETFQYAWSLEKSLARPWIGDVRVEFTHVIEANQEIVFKRSN
jgi:hypothetical protein